MENLTGKTLIFSDIHFGVKSNSHSRLNVCINAVKEIIQAIKTNNVQQVIFGGDYFNQRTSIDVFTLNTALKCLTAIAKHCKVYLILGNHDIAQKTSLDINSLNIFKTIKNVIVVSEVTEINLNNKKTLLCPWLSEYSNLTQESYDIMIGHFDVSTKFLIQSYIEEHSKNNTTSSAITTKIDNDAMLSDTKDTKDDTQSKTGDIIGSFIDYAKPNGLVFSGHIHQHKETAAKGRRFIFIGSPCEITLGDVDNTRGFYILDENSNYKFYETKTTPKHFNLKMSSVIEVGVDNYNFSNLKNKILHKIYDVEIDATLEAKITQKINDVGVFEELLPDYEVSMNYNLLTEAQGDEAKIIQKSKLDYIKNYVYNIDKNVLSSESLEADKLYTLLENYYKKVTEEL